MSNNDNGEEDLDIYPISEEFHCTAKIGGTIIINGRQHWPSFEAGDKALPGETELDVTSRVRAITLDAYLNLAEATRAVIVDYEKEK